jgi:hypothetical protein
MPTIRHHPIAIAVATLIYFFLGAAWFTIFKKPWLAGTGLHIVNSSTDPGISIWLPYVVALVMTAILAIALSWIIQATGSQTATRGGAIAAALWFGFVFTTWATEYAFEARGIPILAINTGYPLVGMLLMGLVLGGWKTKPRTS